jgi:hypothetical protein
VLAPSPIDKPTVLSDVGYSNIKLPASGCGFGAGYIMTPNVETHTAGTHHYNVYIRRRED